MTAGEVAAILFPLFMILVILRVPVAVALGLACIPVFLLEDRLTPLLLMNEMFKSYNSFLLMAVPFFLLAANIMNAAGITDRLMRRESVRDSRLPGVVALASMALVGLAMAKLLEAGRLGTLASTGAALAAVGFLVAMLFAYASLERRPDQRRVIAPLYSADLVGGSAGSIVATLLLIPVTGLVSAVILTLALVVFALLLT